MLHTAPGKYVPRADAGRHAWSASRSALSLCALLAFLLLMLAPQPVAFGQANGDNANQPQSETLTRLKVIQAEAEARQAIAEAKRAELDARFPQSSATPLSGTTTFKDDNARVEEQLVGYISVAEAANRIADAIHRHHPQMTALAVLNDGDIQLLLIYSAATRRVETYAGRYNRVTATMQTALAADPVWTGPSAPCDPKTLVAGLGGAAFNPLSAVTSVLGSFNDILSFFRTDVSIEGSKLTVGEPVIVTETFRALRVKYGNGLALYYPREIPPHFDPEQDSRMLNLIESLFNSKVDADSLNARIAQRIAEKNKIVETLQTCRNLANQEAMTKSKELIAAENKIKKLEDEINQLPAGAAGEKQRREKEAQLAEERKHAAPLQAAHEAQRAPMEAIVNAHGKDIERIKREIAALQTAVQPLVALNAQTELLVKDLIKVDEKTNLNPLTAFIRAERIYQLLKGTGGYWLKLNVVNAGGTTKVKRNLIIDVFNGGPRVRYSGASTVEYHLYDRFGRSLLSDTTNSYIKDKKAKDVQNVSQSALQTTDQR